MSYKNMKFLYSVYQTLKTPPNETDETNRRHTVLSTVLTNGKTEAMQTDEVGGRMRKIVY